MGPPVAITRSGPGRPPLPTGARREDLREMVLRRGLALPPRRSGAEPLDRDAQPAMGRCGAGRCPGGLALTGR